LGDISKKHICLAVAGTHGKTTTSALLAHLFKSNGHSVFAFLGGISSNYNTNFIAGKADSILIAEADEYDRSFLSLSPAGGIITSIDADHLDVYGESKELENTFGQFKDRIEKIAIVHENTKLKGLTYSIEGSTSYSGRNVRIENHNYTFDLILPSGDMIENISSGLPGRHNLENAIAAAALALNFGLTSEEVSKGIASFKGVKRRFDYHIKSPELVYIDDYAHHPAEINALIGSIRELYPNKKITAIFQPHLFSRTRDFADDFAASLSEVDELILMDIFPAREKPIPGISSSMLLSKVQLENKHHFSAQEILTHVGYNKPEVIVTIGAGDIGMLVNQLKMKLLQ
jgi:UDP-N-acetylmuramate--alanine ligase